SSVEELASQFFTEKAQGAISRVGYMEVSEIETFFITSEVLIEAGDFAEIVWALLTDKRREVVEHGYQLLNRTYESLEEPHVNGQETLLNTEQLEEIQPQYVYDAEDGRQQSDAPVSEIAQLEQQLANSKADYTSLEQSHDRLDQQRSFLLQENRGLKSEADAYHENNKRLKTLEEENRILREQVARYIDETSELQQLAEERELLIVEKGQLAEKLKEYEQVKAVKETFTADLKLVEEAIYKEHQELEDFQRSLDNHFDTLESCHQTARGALNQIRQTLAYLDTQELNASQRPYGMTSEQPRVGVFVDVQNMFYAAKDRFGRRVDYIKLLDLIVGPRYLMVAYAYVVQIPEINQSSFLSLLEHNGYTIKSKDLRLRGDGSAKGDWDVGIAVDVVSMLGSLDVVILASGDGDFCPLAELIKQQDKRVEVVAFEHNTSMDLQQIADQFFPIGDELLI
ncbi:NYN domain-containing protein, partial [Candidatus Poribacteria bacterium]|nr:NYN domain-containing protein [Candidatus Poribacteria bacterium]